MSIGGGFRGMWQPCRTFIAGTKVNTYITLRNKQREDRAHRQPFYKMIKDDFLPSPPASPVDLTSPVQLPSGTPALSTCTVTTATAGVPASPKVLFDGVTFTANVADFFTIATPSSPPESEPEAMDYTITVDSPVSVTDTEPNSPGSSLSRDGFIDTALAEAAIAAVRSVPSLATVVNDALLTGSVTPLIKEELKCTIQSKRLSEGKGELKVEMRRKEERPKLTPEEEERRHRRRERNKLAAQRCRIKKTERARILLEETEILERTNQTLLADIANLKREIESLRDMMTRHDKSTQCDETLLSQADKAMEKLKKSLQKKLNTCRQAEAKTVVPESDH